MTKTEKKRQKRVLKSAQIRDLKKKLSGTVNAKTLRKAFPTQSESKAQQLRAIRKKARGK